VNILVAFAGMLLPVFVLGHAGAAFFFIYRWWSGLSLGWALALCLYSLLFMQSGYKTMALFNRTPELQGFTNVVAAPTLSLGTALALSLWFSVSPLAQSISAWWALLFPFAFIPFLFLHAGIETLLNTVNPAGRRS
jgi:hypothetical protein